MNDLTGSTFGNYLVHGIAEVEFPEPIAWLPQTAGWQVLAVLLFLLAVYLGYRAGRRWWRNRYRRAALKKLSAVEEAAAGEYLQVAAALPHLLKATALQAWPRIDVAALSGDQWLAFLDAHYGGPRFRSATGQYLLVVAYQPPASWQLEPADARKLIAMARHWLRKHTLGAPSAKHA